MLETQQDTNAVASPEATFGRMIEALNRHDLEEMVACFAPDFRSDQPIYSGRAITGRGGVRRNWDGFFANMPDVQADVLSKVIAGDTVWCEIRFHGTQRNGDKWDVRGVTIQCVRDNQIAWARLYVENVQG